MVEVRKMEEALRRTTSEATEPAGKTPRVEAVSKSRLGGVF